MSTNSIPAEERVLQPRTFSMTDLAMLFVVVIWGGNLTISRAIFASIPPLPFIAIRFGTAALLLLIILRLRGEDLSAGPGLRWRSIWVGLAGNTLYQWCFMFGLSLTTAGNTALLISTTPLWIALIGTFRGTERLTRTAWGGVGLSFAGIALVVASRGLSLDATTLLGDVLVLISAVCWAIYTIGAKPLLARYSALKTTTLTMIGGTPLLVLAGIPGMLNLSWPNVPISAWAGVGYASLLSLVLAYIIWYSSVQRVGSVRTSLYGNLVPVVAVLIAWGFGGEQITPAQIVGAVSILGGLWLTRR